MRDKPRKAILVSEKIEDHSGVNEARATAVATALSMTPFGNLIKGIFIDYPNAIRLKRIEETLSYIQKEFENSQFNLGNINPEDEDFYDFSKLVLQKGDEIRSDERRKALAQLYVNAIINQLNFDSDPVVIMIKYVGELSDLQLILLREIHTNAEEFQKIQSYSDYCELLDKAKIKLPYPEIIRKESIDLENKGLLDSQGLFSEGDGIGIIVLEKDEGHHIYITEFGKAFLNYIISEG